MSTDNSGNIVNTVICFYVLKFSKENCFTLLFYCTVLCPGRSTKEGLNHLLHRTFLRKNQETLQILIISNKFSQKCFILPIYCTALCTERFQPPHSLSTSKKKLGHITNINVWSYNLKFSEKSVLYFHFTALCYVQEAQKKLKIACFIEYLEPYDNLKKYIIKANPNNSIFEEVNNFNQTSKPEIDENILLYFDL